MKKNTRKLQVNKTTLKKLSATDLNVVAGGGLTNNNCSLFTCATE